MGYIARTSREYVDPADVCVGGSLTWNDAVVRKFRRSGADQRGAERPRFDPAETDWTGVTASFYFFEPWCGEFSPPGPGEVVIAFGEGRDRHRGLQVDVWEDGKGVSLWVPDTARVFWSPAAQPEERDHPWETRLRELDASTGTLLDES